MPSECFIIMPISTPEAFHTTYGGDKDHFEHVLEHLFKPAITNAGLTPVPPSAQGSDLIQAEIIKQIETADMVLCDMSTLNANVFFELGIRTAVNKPICLVRDDHTKHVPFDIGNVNYHTYHSNLALWNNPGQIEQLTAHLKKSVTNSSGGNSMWKYYSLSARAALNASKPTDDDRVELLSLKLDGLMRKLEQSDEVETKPLPSKRTSSIIRAERFIATAVNEFAIPRERIIFDDDTIKILGKVPTDYQTFKLVSLAKALGFNISIL